MDLAEINDTDSSDSFFDCSGLGCLDLQSRFPGRCIFPLKFPPWGEQMPLLSLQPSDGCFKKVPPPTRVFHEAAGEPVGHRAFHGVYDDITLGSSGDGTLDSAWTAAMEFTSLECLSQHVYQNGNLFSEASSVVY